MAYGLVGIIVVVLAASAFAASNFVQTNHVFRRKGNNTDINNRNGSNIFRGSRDMELSRSILVHQIETPYLVCYNSTFPYLISLCDPGEGYQCSVEPPTYGCSKASNLSCNEIHLCNSPVEIFVTAALLAIGIIILITTGCLWCCCCCCCGKCCKNTCPCFAKLQMRTFRPVIHSPTNRVYPSSSRAEWTMYDYGGKRTPDTLIATTQKQSTMENDQNKFFDRTDFPQSDMSPSAPRISHREQDIRQNNALQSVPVYSPHRNEKMSNDYY